MVVAVLLGEVAKPGNGDLLQLPLLARADCSTPARAPRISRRRRRRWPAPGGGHRQQLQGLASCSMSPRAPRIRWPAPAPAALASTCWWPPAAAPGPGQLLEVSPGAADPPAGAGGSGQHLVVATGSSSRAWPAARCRPGPPGSAGRRRRRWPAPAGGHLQQLLDLASCSMSPRAPRITRPAPPALATTRCWPPAVAPGPGQLLEVSPGAADPPAGAGGSGQHLVAATGSSSRAWPAARCRPGRRGSRPAPAALASTWWWPPAAGPGPGQLLEVSPGAADLRPAPAALASTCWWRPAAAGPGPGQLLDCHWLLRKRPKCVPS